jgi:hypothetical protein
VAVLVSVAKIALPFASLVAPPVIEHAALLTDTPAPGDGTCGVPCCASTVTLLAAVELNGVPVIV